MTLSAADVAALRGNTPSPETVIGKEEAALLWANLPQHQQWNTIVAGGFVIKPAIMAFKAVFSKTYRWDKKQQNIVLVGGARKFLYLVTVIILNVFVALRFFRLA